jgi:hypothetical protein
MKSWASAWVISGPTMILLSFCLLVVIAVQGGCSRAIASTKTLYKGPCEFVTYKYDMGSNLVSASLNCGSNRATCAQGPVVFSHIQNPCEFNCTVNGNLSAECEPCAKPEDDSAAK